MDLNERRAILIDLDGVIRLWPGTHRPPPGQERATVEHDLGTIAFGPDLLHGAITGRIDDPTWRRQVEAALAVTWPDHARDAVAAWSALRPPVDERVVGLVRGWRAEGFPVVLVTNATSRLGADLHDLSIQDLFDAVVNSSEVGLAKPDPRIFAVALARAGLPAERAIFIDDTLANVESARASGLAGYHYRGDPGALDRAVSRWRSGAEPIEAETPGSST